MLLLLKTLFNRSTTTGRHYTIKIIYGIFFTKMGRKQNLIISNLLC